MTGADDDPGAPIQGHETSAISPERAARTLFAALSSRDLREMIAMLAPQGALHFPGVETLVGPHRVERFLKVLFYRYPRLDFTVRRVIADANAAAVEWTNEGEDREGAPYRNAGVTVLALEDGRVVYISDTFKDTSLFLTRRD